MKKVLRKKNFLKNKEKGRDWQNRKLTDNTLQKSNDI